ncbi:MAG: SDR family NAD(P)-dependent oxidoreductase, partial [Mycobacterium sp.]
MQLSFEDRTYLVTGGGSGIGKGVAAGLVAAGASVMIVGRNADRLAEAVKEIEALPGGGSIRYEPTDVTNEDEVTRAVDAAIRR